MLSTKSFVFLASLRPPNNQGSNYKAVSPGIAQNDRQGDVEIEVLMSSLQNSKRRSH